MMLNTMRDLLIHELQDLYGAEKQLVKGLPLMARAATAPQLETAFQEHLQQTERQMGRLEECFKLLDEDAKSMKCKGMEGLLKEGSDMIDEDANTLVRDAGLIGAAQRVEHYEIAAYGTCIELAKLLGETQVADILNESLEEEKQTDQLLTSIAESEVNPKAMMSAADEREGIAARRRDRGSESETGRKGERQGERQGEKVGAGARGSR